MATCSITGRDVISDFSPTTSGEVIGLGGNNSITLQHVHKADLNAGDFVFL